MEIATTDKGSRIVIIGKDDPEPFFLEDSGALDNPLCDVWLTRVPYKDPAFTGDGTASFPKYLADGFIDETLLAAGYNPVTFHLLAGTYYTRGVWAFARREYATLAPGQKLVGAGSAYTQVILKDPVLATQGEPRVNRDTHLMWAGRERDKGDRCGCVVEGVTLIAGGPESASVVGGLYFWGSDFTARDVIVRGIRGSYERQLEVFGIGCDSFGGALVERCQVGEVVPNSYVSGISIGCSDSVGFATTPNVVRDCIVHLGDSNWFGVSASRSTTIDNVRCGGVKIGFYHDTDILLDIKVVNCDFIVGNTGVSLVQTKSGWFKKGLTLRSCRFTFVGSGAALIGLELFDKTPEGDPAFAHIRVSDCEFGAGPENFYLATTNAKKLRDVSIVRATAPRAMLNQKSVKEGKILVSGTDGPTGDPVVTQNVA